MNINDVLLSLRDDKLEYELLSAVFAQPEQIKNFYVNEEAFSNPVNKDIYIAMKAMEAGGYVIDYKTLLEVATDLQLDNREHILRVCGDMYDNRFTDRNLDFKQDKLQELYEKRQYVILAKDIIENSENKKSETIELSIKNRIKKVEKTKPIKKETHIGYYLDANIETMEAPKSSDKPSLMHLRDLDQITKGMKREELIIIGANPSVGKTVLATTIAENHALKNNGINLIFSLEMSGKSLTRRMMASLTNIHSSRINNAYEQFTVKEWQKTVEMTEIFKKTNTHLIEESSLTVEQICSQSRIIKDLYKESEEHMVIYIDYVGLIKKTNENTQERLHLKHVASSLKALAKELDATIVLLSQLSRDNEKQNRKPMMSDLKDSQDLEAAADVIILLYREDYQGRETEKKDVIDMIVAKNRNGDLGTAEMKFMKAFSKFINIG